MKDTGSDGDPNSLLTFLFLFRVITKKGPGQSTRPFSTSVYPRLEVFLECESNCETTLVESGSLGRKSKT